MNKLFVFPTPDATGTLTHDTGIIVNAVPDTHPTGRAGRSFTIPPGTPNLNGSQLDLRARGYLPFTQRGTLGIGPLSTFAADDFHLVPDPKFVPLLPLHSEGWDIKQADGSRYVHNQCTNYLLFQRFLEGADITPLLYPGFDGYNVTFLMSVVPGQAGLRALRPENYPNYFQRVEDFLRFMFDAGKRVEATLLCDCDQLGVDHNWQVGFVNQMYEILRAFPNLVQLANEPEKNGVDFVSFGKPAGIFWSRGSSLAGGPCPLPAGDYSTQHLSRNAGGDHLDASPYYMAAGYSGYAGTQGPVITNETRGASDTENSGRRTTDPNYFRRIAGAMSGWCGGTFHPEFGIHSDPLNVGSVQDKCRLGFLEGIQ